MCSHKQPIFHFLLKSKHFSFSLKTCIKINLRLTHCPEDGTSWELLFEPFAESVETANAAEKGEVGWCINLSQTPQVLID